VVVLAARWVDAWMHAWVGGRRSREVGGGGGQHGVADRWGGRRGCRGRTGRRRGRRCWRSTTGTRTTTPPTLTPATRMSSDPGGPTPVHGGVAWARCCWARGSLEEAAAEGGDRWQPPHEHVVLRSMMPSMRGVGPMTRSCHVLSQWRPQPFPRQRQYGGRRRRGARVDQRGPGEAPQGGARCRPSPRAWWEGICRQGAGCGYGPGPRPTHTGSLSPAPVLQARAPCAVRAGRHVLEARQRRLGS
jgi:hypothetical protein